MARPEQDDEKFSDAEANRRAETALRAAFNSPHKTYEESKLGKKRGSARAKPRPQSRQKRDDRR
jgi:hypothetical protein